MKLNRTSTSPGGGGLKNVAKMGRSRGVVVAAPGQDGLDRGQAGGQRAEDQSGTPDFGQAGGGGSDAESGGDEPQYIGTARLLMAIIGPDERS